LHPSQSRALMMTAKEEDVQVNSKQQQANVTVKRKATVRKLITQQTGQWPG
jgi:hypothetical protein